MNHCAVAPDHRSFLSTVIMQTHTYTHTHTQTDTHTDTLRADRVQYPDHKVVGKKQQMLIVELNVFFQSVQE